jgi:hypothetical protein
MYNSNESMTRKYIKFPVINRNNSKIMIKIPSSSNNTINSNSNNNFNTPINKLIIKDRLL